MAIPTIFRPRNRDVTKTGAYQQTEGQYRNYMAAVPGTVRQAMAPVYTDINASLTPTVSAARNYVAANPYAGRSGAANVIRESILRGAYGDLARAGAGAAGGAAAGGLDFLRELLMRRVQDRYTREAEQRAKKKSGLEVATGVAGSVLPYLAPGAGAASAAASPYTRGTAGYRSMYNPYGR